MTDHELDSLLRASTPGFDPGFADRVMARLEADPAWKPTDPIEVSGPDVFAITLRRQFRRVAPIGLAASLLLAAFNLVTAQADAGQTPVEAVLGLEPVSAAMAYSVPEPGLDEEGP